jgi:L-ornithine Nalpha-acyltransferase
VPALRTERDPGDRAPVFGRLGSLEVRLARTAAEVRMAQALRYRVFYEEGRAIPTATSRRVGCDADAFDPICDHLLVFDHDAQDADGSSAAVGTYRLLCQEQAARHGGFYSAGEFDIGDLVARHTGLRFLELGRSCVLAPYRNKRTLELLWHGIGAYAAQYRPDVMIGCASLDGTDPDALALPLSFLHRHARAPENWRAHALPGRAIAMDRLPRDAVDPAAALRVLPPLIKGYLRLGAYVGEDAVVDSAFGSVDVLIVLPMSRIKTRYFARFSPRTQRDAA